MTSTVRRTLSFFAAVGALLAFACGDLKSAAPAAGDDGGVSASSSSGAGSSSGTSSSGGGSSSGSTTSSSSSGSTSSGGVTGPGPHGALPSGYCCAHDTDCRYRHCVGGVCKDDCDSTSSCTRPDLSGWTCDASSQFEPGICQPPTDFACIASALFNLGTRKAGECCTANGMGTSGLECEGGRCLTVGAEGNNNPFVCTNACEQPADCETGFVCNADIGACIPGNDPYTCK